MTDKTTIDVSKCEFFTPTEVTVLGGGFETQIYCGQVNEFSDDAFTKNAPNLHCERNPNCYFKQLVRAKEELEKIRNNCKETLSECSCKNPIIDVDCRECTSGGRVEKAKEILYIINSKAKDGE